MRFPVAAKSRCIERAQTAAARVHQFPPGAHRSVRCRRLVSFGALLIRAIWKVSKLDWSITPLVAVISP